MLKYFIFILSIFLMIISCSKKELEVVQMKDTDLNTQMIEAYNEGLDFLEKGDAFNAAKKFSEAELFINGNSAKNIRNGDAFKQPFGRIPHY